MSDTNRWKTPWSVSTERLTCIRDCDGNYVVINVDLATAALIVEAVNERRRNIDRIEQLRAACLAAIDRMTKTRDGLIDYIHT